MMEAGVEHYLVEYSRLQSSSPAAWLKEVRDTAIEQFRSRGFPTTRNEDWKYTDVKPIVRRNFIPSVTGSGTITEDIAGQLRINDLDCYELVFINGIYSQTLSNLDGLADGTIISSVAEVIESDNNSISSWFKNSGRKDSNAFDTLNSAFVSDGAFIHVPDEAELDKPVHLLFVGHQLTESQACHIRNFINIGSNSRATVIESYTGIDEAEYFTNTITEAAVARGAKLGHYKLQRESINGYHVGSLRAELKGEAVLESHSISLGGSLVRNNIVADLDEAGAEIFMNGLYIAGGDQHVDNHTCVNHRVAHTRSRENYRGVLDGKARGVFNGKVVVHEQAQKTEAHQANDNLLLSNEAEVDTKPELEIYADDVKCSHGATVGQLDENMLFYLRSRAIDRDTARSLLTFAFAEEIINRIRITPVRKKLEQSVVGKLPDTDLIRGFMK